MLLDALLKVTSSAYPVYFNLKKIHAHENLRKNNSDPDHARSHHRTSEKNLIRLNLKAVPHVRARKLAAIPESLACTLGSSQRRG